MDIARLEALERQITHLIQAFIRIKEEDKPLRQMRIFFLDPYESLDQVRDLSFQSLKSCYIHEATLRTIALWLPKSEDAASGLLRYTETKRPQDDIEMIRKTGKHISIQPCKICTLPCSMQRRPTRLPQSGIDAL